MCRSDGGKGVFVAPDPPARLSPTLCEAFLKEVMIRASAMGMTADDVAVGILSLAGVHPAVAKADTEVLLVECSQQELDFFAREFQAHRLAQLPPGTRVGVASDHPETAHNLEHSITNGGLLSIKFLGTCCWRKRW